MMDISQEEMLLLASVKCFMDDAFIKSDITEKALTFVKRVNTTYYSKPRCALFYGPTDRGKTTIINHYIKNTNTVYVRKIMRGETLKTFIEGMLTDFGDIDPSYGSNQAKYNRLAALVKARGITMMVFDDFTRLLKGNGTSTNEQIAYLIQSLLDDITKVPIIITGVLKSRAMLENLKEIFRRTPLKHKLTKYGCDTAVREKSFMLFMHYLQQTIPVQCVELTSTNMLKRFYYASDGVPGAIKTLIEQAIINRNDISKSLSMRDFQNAFDLVHERSDEDDIYIHPAKSKADLDDENELFIPEFNPFHPKITEDHLNKHLNWYKSKGASK